jgi:rubrerythrin
LKPDRLEPVIHKIREHEKPEERETMLYSLYASMADREEPKKIIESFLMMEIEEKS